MKVRPIPTRAPGRSRREEQRLETRERLYAAALDEFRRVGFANAQIDPIAEKAGVARGTFYFHFPTKEHVLMELQSRIEARIVERFADLPESAGSVREFLQGVVKALVDSDDVADPALARELIAMYVREPRVVDVSKNQFVVALVDYFTDAAERGEVRSDIAPADVAAMFLRALFGFLSTSVGPFGERLDEFATTIDVFARGIAP